MSQIMAALANNTPIKPMLYEGMTQGDLEGLVIPTISVDEYESKIDKEAIVMGFYVHDEDAANDLNRFIQRAAVRFLDSDVSPAPDQHGYYLVFIEMMNDDTFASAFAELLHDISTLTAIKNDEWEMHVRGKKDSIDFSEEELEKISKSLRIKKDSNKIQEFFRYSDVKDIIIESDDLSIVGTNSVQRYLILGFGSNADMNSRFDLDKSPLNFGLYESASSSQLASLLGSGWHVDAISDYIVLRNSNEECLVLKSTI